MICCAAAALFAAALHRYVLRVVPRRLLPLQPTLLPLATILMRRCMLQPRRCSSRQRRRARVATQKMMSRCVLLNLCGARHTRWL
jgi:hypothetical protein